MNFDMSIQSEKETQKFRYVNSHERISEMWDKFGKKMFERAYIEERKHINKNFNMQMPIQRS